MRTRDEVLDLLNELQKDKWIRILEFEGLTLIALRPNLKKEVEGVIEWIKDYTDLWGGIKSGDYYVAQPNKFNLARMKDFLKEYDFTKEEILMATKSYIASKRLVGNTYMKKSHKFIEDLDGSELYSWCMAIRSGKEVKQERVQGI
jgi:hypothetical protein